MDTSFLSLTPLQLSGWVLIVLGGVAQGFFSSYIQFFNDRYETPAIGIIILGAIIVFISFFGCCGAKRENVYMLRIVSGYQEHYKLLNPLTFFSIKFRKNRDYLNFN